MAVSQIHFRSISLPSRLHPINSSVFEAEFEKLKSFPSSSPSKKTAPITSQIVQSGLIALAELYNSLTQSQSLSHHDEKPIQDSLESSVELLDTCNNMRELAGALRENVQVLQSALRRKGLESSIQDDVASYFCFRKKMNKCIAKSLKTLRNVESKSGTNLGDDGFISALKEASGISIGVFRSALVFLSSPTVKSGSWNLVSKLMLAKSVAYGKDHSVVGEVGCVDLSLNHLQRSDYKAVDRQIVQRELQNLECCVEGIEGGLERLFRQLLQTRVSLLNSVAHH